MADQGIGTFVKDGVELQSAGVNFGHISAKGIGVIVLYPPDSSFAGVNFNHLTDKGEGKYFPDHTPSSSVPVKQSEMHWSL